MSKKTWWRIAHRNEHGKIIDGQRVYAATRKEAKELAAQHWGLTSTTQLTAISDRSSYNIGPEETH